MGHKARPKKAPQPAANNSRPAPEHPKAARLSVEALGQKVRHAVRPDKQRHKRIREGNGFGKQDLVAWKRGPGRAKSWRTPKPVNSNSAAGTGFLMDMVLAGAVVTQVFRPLLPNTLLRTATRLAYGQIASAQTVFKTPGRVRKPLSIDDDDFLGSRTMNYQETRQWKPPRQSDLARFLFKRSLGCKVRDGCLFEEYLVQDKDLEYSHLAGFLFAEEHRDLLREICREELRISPVAYQLVAVNGFIKVAVVGKRLEEPSPFTRYRYGTMTVRVRRYFEDFPKPGSCSNGETNLSSDFVKFLEAPTVQRKKEVRRAKQRRKRKGRRAAAACERVLKQELIV